MGPVASTPSTLLQKQVLLVVVLVDAHQEAVMALHHTCIPACTCVWVPLIRQTMSGATWVNIAFHIWGVESQMRMAHAHSSCLVSMTAWRAVHPSNVSSF